MKYLLFIILLVAILITVGCVTQNNNAAVPPNPRIVYVTVLVTPIQTPYPTPTSQSVYGLASNPSAGITEIRFTFSPAPGALRIDLTKMKIEFSAPSTTPITLT